MGSPTQHTTYKSDKDDEGRLINSETKTASLEPHGLMSKVRPPIVVAKTKPSS